MNPARRRKRIAILAWALALCGASTLPAGAQGEVEPGAPGSGERGLALRAAKALLCTFDGPQVLDHPLVLVREGRIERVGPAGKLEVPEGYASVDVGERWLAPGLIDLHCHVAGPHLLKLNDINDLVYMANPGLRVSPAVIPGNPMLRRAVAGGVTTVLHIPGSGTNISGQGVLLKTGFERFEDMCVRNPGSLKLAQAGNPERWLIGAGRSLMNWTIRNTFRRGLAYARERAGRDQGVERLREVQWDVFPALYGHQTQVSTHTQIYQVVLMTIEMVKGELGLDVYIDHGTFDGWRAAPEALAKGVPAVLGPREVSVPRNRFLDTDGQIQGVAAKYQEMGFDDVAFNTDAPIVPQEELPLQAAMGVHYGLDVSNLEQIRALTIIPARIAGIDDRVGSLEVGKDADIIVVTGDPVDPRSSVETVFIEGRRVYDTSRERRRW